MARGRENIDGRYEKTVRELWGRETLMSDRGKEKEKEERATVMADVVVGGWEDGRRNTNDRRRTGPRGGEGGERSIEGRRRSGRCRQWWDDEIERTTDGKQKKRTKWEMQTVKRENYILVNEKTKERRVQTMMGETITGGWQKKTKNNERHREKDDNGTLLREDRRKGRRGTYRRWWGRGTITDENKERKKERRRRCKLCSERQFTDGRQNKRKKEKTIT